MSKGYLLILTLFALLVHSFAHEVEIQEFDQEMAKNIFENGKQAMIIFCNEDEHTKEFEEYTKAAHTLEDKYQFCKSNIHEGMGVRLAEYIGVTDKNLPTIYILKVTGGRDMKKYAMDAEITSENIIKFNQDFEEDKLIPTRKSEEIPETNDGPVKKVVGKNFQDIVMDSTKDVLIKIYAPWCGHCRKLAPTYEKVAKLIEHNPNIVITEYDGSKNENEEISITGYPTVIFFPSNNKASPITFQSSRTEEAILDFLKKHTTHKWIDQQEVQEEL